MDILGDGFSVTALATPSAPTLAVEGTPGSTHYGYKVVALFGTTHTPASAEATATTGAATLTETDAVLVTPVRVAGATGYDVYRTTGGATQGKIGTVRPRTRNDVQTGGLRDTGLVASGSAPTTNTTAVATIDKLEAVSAFGLGLTPIARRTHIADAAGTDAAIINAILDALEAFGFLATS